MPAKLLTAGIAAGHFPTCISRGGSWLRFKWAMTRTEDERATIVPATRPPNSSWIFIFFQKSAALPTLLISCISSYKTKAKRETLSTLLIFGKALFWFWLPKSWQCGTTLYLLEHKWMGSSPAHLLTFKTLYYCQNEVDLKFYHVLQATFALYVPKFLSYTSFSRVLYIVIDGSTISGEFHIIKESWFHITCFRFLFIYNKTTAHI